jgi:membrane-bound metal-dependent hydrolase YbcI (DUF457 family)
VASFRTHISVGIALGVAGAIGSLGLAFAPASFDVAILIFIACTIGALMPDMDSDSGIPFHVTFGSLSLITAGLIFYYALQRSNGDYLIATLSALSAGAIIWAAIGSVFKKCTKHRGMAHSTPAAILAGLVTLTLALAVQFDSWTATYLGIAVTAGYLAHLMLDEFHAAVNFHGTPFIPNKALGSALKFTSRNKAITTSVYIAIILLIIWNSDVLSLLANRVTQ